MRCVRDAEMGGNGKWEEGGRDKKKINEGEVVRRVRDAEMETHMCLQRICISHMCAILISM